MDLNISVIVPIYNVEKYLSDCLESILCQQGVQFEVICVEDGSTDSSKTIVQEYVLRDTRIHAIYHDRNKGPSVSRNDGMDAAKGKYIWFVDSDDTITEQSLKTLFDCAEEFNGDMISFGLECVFENRELAERYPAAKFRYNGNYEETLNGQKMLADLLKGYEFASGCVPRFFFRRDFLREKGLYFKEEIIFEDNLYIPLCFLKAERVKCLNEVYYRYLKRENSITTSKIKQIEAESLFVCYKELCKIILNIELDENGRYGLSEVLSNLCISIKNIAVNENVRYKGKDPLDRHLWNMICGSTHSQVIETRVRQITEGNMSNGLYLYGAGRYGEEVLAQLNRLDISINGVVVTKRMEKRTSIWGHPVIELEDLYDRLQDATVLVAVSGEIGAQIEVMLKKSGIKSVFTIESDGR